MKLNLCPECGLGPEIEVRHDYEGPVITFHDVWIGCPRCGRNRSAGAKTYKEAYETAARFWNGTLPMTFLLEEDEDGR